MKLHQYYVYIISNQANTVLYVGVTNDLKNRVSEHKLKIFKGFTATYNCNKLVYFEDFQWIDDGSRQKKINLVTADNPLWKDLSDGWYD
jgi:putative endonuclease